MLSVTTGDKARLFSIILLLVGLQGCGKKKETITHHLSDIREVAAEEKKFISDEYKARGAGSGPQWYRGLTYADLVVGKKRHLETGRLDWAIKYTERMIKLSHEPDEIERLRLELANLLFDHKEFGRAANSYTFYAESYPGSTDAVEAKYKAILAKSKEIKSADRDTTEAEEVVRLGGEFLEDKDNKKFRPEVEALVKHALKVLYHSDLLTFYFYFNRKQYNSAQGRLNLMKERYLDKGKPYWYTPDLEPELLVLEYELAAASDNQELVQQKHAELAERYPQYREQVEEKHKKKKTDYTTRF